jgi:hypothetical protein
MKDSWVNDDFFCARVPGCTSVTISQQHAATLPRYKLQSAMKLRVTFPLSAPCRRFTMPQAGPDKPWYSFDFGPIHFLQYSTEHVFAPGGYNLQSELSDLL